MQMPDSTPLTITDSLDPARAAALHHTLSQPGPPPQAGDPLPPFWHQIYFWHPLPPDQLGPDSHIKNGVGLVPNLGLAQRMWAGGHLTFHAPLLVGKVAQKVSFVQDVTLKNGTSGPLGFVKLRHEIRQRGQLCVTEIQDLVFKNYPDRNAKPNLRPAPTDETQCTTLGFSSTLLFRYSALTFNGHRIHYDVDYCRDVEGYSGLVVHGPLLAQNLMRLAARQIGGLKTFGFRATSPLMHHETADFCWNDGALWVRGPDGRLCMQANAT